MVCEDIYYIFYTWYARIYSSILYYTIYFIHGMLGYIIGKSYLVKMTLITYYISYSYYNYWVCV